MITVVSGLPRSGTSLVMQMLAAGGIPVLGDDLRRADEDNPRGYLEYEKVKSLERDSTWLPEEVLRSQEKMLERRGQPPGPPAEMMAAHFQKHLQTVEQWLSRQPNIQVHYCDHAQLIESPAQTSALIQEFLKLLLNTEKMTACVAPELHRQK